MPGTQGLAPQEWPASDYDDGDAQDTVEVQAAPPTEGNAPNDERPDEQV